MRSFTLAVAAAALSTGCATERLQRPIQMPTAVPVVYFGGLEAAPSGLARLYILRPDLNDLLTRESPTFSINGQELLQLKHRSYSSVALQPGKYSVLIQAGRFEAESWNSRSEFRVKANGIYFLSILKEFDRPKHQAAGDSRKSAGSLDMGTSTSATPSGVTHHFLDQLQAVALLRGLEYVAPRREHLTLAPEQ